MNLSFRSEDRNKWIAGAVLAVIAGSLLYRTFWPARAPSSAPPSRARAGSPFSTMDSPAGPKGRVSPAGRRRAAATASAPQLDPRLRLDLLAKVHSVSYQGSERNIFQYYTPPPPVDKPVANPVTGPGGAAAKPPGPPPAPPPPIPLKYYGYAEKPLGSPKKAFFSDGEEIFIAAEGDIVNKKYKIVKIGVNTVEAEDITTKHRQVLPLQEQQ
jgi:hypothetical protein